MHAAGLVAAFVFGLAFGSFATVVVHRVPLGLSVASPPSSCPGCGAAIAWYDNIPLVSYLVLRGRCRHCTQRISPRYPVVELISGLVWVALAARIGFRAELPAFLAFGSTLVILSAIDLQHHRLPNRVLGPAAVIAVVLLVTAAGFGGRWHRLEDAGIGAAAYGLPMLILGVAAPAAMGGGDVKFAPYLGFHLGWFGLRFVLVGALLGLLAGGLGGAALLLIGRKSMKDAIPFGPFLAFGALLAVLGGPSVVRLWV
jgi:leader peptidase (prepilin peptidase)/N-methyltransferase